MTPATRNLKLRWILAYVSLAVLAVILGFTLVTLATTSISEGIELRQFREVLKESVQIRLGISSNLFQLAVLITGALWGLMIAKRDESGLVFADRQEIIMFFCASLLLLTSLLSSVIYTYRVAYLYELADQINPPDASPLMVGDFFNPVIDHFFTYQIMNLVAGLVVATVTFISAHKLK